MFGLALPSAVASSGEPDARGEVVEVLSWHRHRVPSRAQATQADERGEFVWFGRRFRTTASELEELWRLLPPGTEATDVTVVMEPTRNAWLPLAAWFRRRGAAVVVIPTERSADLRDYYSKHPTTDRLDSRILARLPLLHPEGLHADEGLRPADALKRTAKHRSTLVKRSTQCLARLDAMLELLGPGWDAALRGDLAKGHRCGSWPPATPIRTDSASFKRSSPRSSPASVPRRSSSSSAGPRRSGFVADAATTSAGLPAESGNCPSR